MALPLGILDQSPVLAGATPSDAVHATIALARDADRLGYSRYWLAEHHAMRGLADPAPEILLAHLAGVTSRIRIGTGGVLLPHYAALKVAEQFRMLEALAPGRIDLGIGRAPGGTQRVSVALESTDVHRFPRQVADVVGFLDRDLPHGHPYAKLVAMPSGETSPEVWLLGSSDYSAALAAELGLPFAFAHFISGDAPAVTHMYRRHFRASRRLQEPRVLLAVAAIAAEAADQAESLAATIDLWRLRIRRGVDLSIPSHEEALAYPYTVDEREEIAYNRRRLALGTPAGVRDRIEELARTHEADEAMVLTITPDYASRARSYELLAAAFALGDEATDRAQRHAEPVEA
jgi:luciferase family oxidoreductase group 1